ncbi:hypothetical protein Rhe02_29010 [Rhizocola hellebori]|uniref:ATP-grasp domain-containing protein n=1 Tax=Rhizocola hellebori TaxID=1392758 RepID=A0A8J3Q7G2_9ACTN|nr:ATP-grasp domain-containing protein [Rhizocola hellebori]GIH04834.1 hypothetical protein Rhe02_29010 [Rhizocola hellebori]
MSWQLEDYRLVTASAYPGMMAPLTDHPSCVCVLSGDSGGGSVAAPTLSLEELDGVRRRWRFGDVARLADFVPKVLAGSAPDDRPMLLVPPRSSAAWQAAALAWPGRVQVVGTDRPRVRAIAEDKVYVREQLERLGVPVPQAVVVAADQIDFREHARLLDLPFVLQAPEGAGGQGTYLIHAKEDLYEAITRHPHVERWLASRYCGDITINVAGVVHRDGVQLFPASVQSSGIASVGSGFGAYCGSDFGAATTIAAAVLQQAHHHAGQIGQWLREEGHLGLFGADIAVSGDHLAFLEVNPRIQGSSWLLSRAQRELRRKPCLEQHVQALLGQPLADPGPEPVAVGGSHLLVRWTGPQGIVRSVATQSVAADVAITAAPRLGTVLMPGAIVARLESPHSLAAPDGRSLLPETESRLRSFLASVELAGSAGGQDN